MKHACLAFLLILTVAPFAAAGDPSYVQFGRDIRIHAEQQVGDLTCLGCSIYISGDVSGDVTAVGGSVIMDGDAFVAGDLTTVIGNVRLNDRAKVGGDLAAVGGSLRRQPAVTIGGDVTALEGAAWVWLVLGTPVLILAGLVWLIVWLLQRRRPPAPAKLVRAA